MGIKRVQAIVRNEQVEAIIERLAVVGVRGLTIVPVRGSSAHERRPEVYRSSAYEAPFVPKVALEWCGPEEQVDAVVGAILLRGATGETARSSWNQWLTQCASAPASTERTLCRALLSIGREPATSLRCEGLRPCHVFPRQGSHLPREAPPAAPRLSLSADLMSPLAASSSHMQREQATWTEQMSPSGAS
jgi:nitrogen regulatory protein PII